MITSSLKRSVFWTDILLVLFFCCIYIFYHFTLLILDISSNTPREKILLLLFFSFIKKWIKYIYLTTPFIRFSSSTSKGIMKEKVCFDQFRWNIKVFGGCVSTCSFKLSVFFSTEKNSFFIIHSKTLKPLPDSFYKKKPKSCFWWLSEKVWTFGMSPGKWLYVFIITSLSHEFKCRTDAVFIYGVEFYNVINFHFYVISYSVINEEQAN